MSDSLKLRALSGWAILPLGVLLFITSTMPALLQGGRSPTAGMLGLFGLLAIGVGVALFATPDARLKEGAARRLGVALTSLVLAAGSGFFSILVQRASLFDGLGLLYATLVIVFAALFGFAALACIAIARPAAAAFLSPGDSLLSFGGSIDPLSFWITECTFLVFAALCGGGIAAQAGGGGREGLLLAAALALAALPFFVIVELAICAKGWRHVTKR